MNHNMWMFPLLMSRNFIPDDYKLPPTIYSILNSYVNYENPEPVKIKNLAKSGRRIIFDFDYPLAPDMSREDFECMIINHFMMRRIGYDTMTAFKLALNVKLNEIMPMYIKLFNAINGWEIFNDGEVTIREQITANESSSTINNTTNSNNIVDKRYSDTPQNSLSDVQSGEYVSEYNYDTESGNATSESIGGANDRGNLNETITRTPADKMENYLKFIKEKQNVYTMIFKDLDCLFYQVI